MPRYRCLIGFWMRLWDYCVSNTIVCQVIALKVQSCKLYNNKYVIASTQLTNTESFAFIAVLVLSYWAVKFCLLTEKIIETVKK